MKRVTVKLISVEVKAYNARDEHLEIRILLNDGKNKELVKQLHLAQPASQADDIFKEIRERLKKAHGGSSVGEDPLSGLVHIHWLQDEEHIHDKFARFLGTLNEKIRNAKRKGQSYYDLERVMESAKIDF